MGGRSLEQRSLEKTTYSQWPIKAKVVVVLQAGGGPKDAWWRCWQLNSFSTVLCYSSVAEELSVESDPLVLGVLVLNLL